MDQVHHQLTDNPRENANILSVLTFFWTIKLFKRGYQKVLGVGDLFKPLKEDKSENLGNRLEKEWFKERKKPGRPSLVKAILKTFWFEYFTLGFLAVLNDLVIRLLQPIFLGWLLSYFQKDSQVLHSDALMYAGILVALNGLSVVTINQFILGSFANGMKVRIAVCSVIYRKSLRLSSTALGDTSPGKIVNLLSNDVSRFDIVSIFIHSMWIAPILSCVVAYLLYLEAGLAGLIGCIIVLVVTPIQSFTGKLSSKYRMQTALRTDERVRLMDEIISGVQVIKLYAWEKPFQVLIKMARKMELKIVKKSSYVRGLYMTFMLFTTRAALFCTMMAIILLGGQLTASKVFVVSAYFNILALTLSQMFVRGIAEIAEAMVAMRRLRKFLEYDEKEDNLSDAKDKLIERNLGNGSAASDEKEKLIESETQLPANISLSMKNVTARWTSVEEVKEQAHKKPKKISSNGNKNGQIKDEEKVERHLTLDNISLELKKGSLVGIVGNVGAGKSSMLQAILKELPIQSGSITIRGNSLSFTEQSNWVFAGTIRQNIIFGQEMDRDRYDHVVKACALIKDFVQLPFGDKTIIGERGSSLSGGQKARVSLARAVYRKAEIYLLDDPLSAVDAHVGRHLFDQCIGRRGYLGKSKATRILVTHQVHFLKEADYVVIMKDGKIERQGTPADLANAGVDFVKLMEEKDDASLDGSSIITRGRKNSRSSSRSVESINSQTSFDDDENEKEKSKSPEQAENVEESSKGKANGNVLYNYINAGAPNILYMIFLFLMFLLTQVLASGADFWVAFWTSQEELRAFYSRANGSDIVAASTSELITANATETGLPINDDRLDSLLSTEMCMYIHGGLVISLFFVAIFRACCFYQTTVRASQNLHNAMFDGIIATKMRFFDINPSGRILNRFSKDVGSVDEFLPKTLLDATQIILAVFGSIIVTSMVNPYFLIPLALISVVFFRVRRVYLKTSKNIKRLEGITKSPAFTHLGATLNGLSTIRAFNAQPELIQEFDYHQDLHTGSWFMFYTSSVAFGFALDMMCLMFMFVVTFSFLVVDQDILGDRVGLAITQSLFLTAMLQWGVRQSAEVANQMMSVERIMEYQNLKKEKEPEKPKQVEKSWPSAGAIEFKNVSYKYFEEAEPALRNLSFTIEPGMKYGIVGRTGSGKSSLIGSLFKIAELEGNILIDGVDTSEITLETLRSKISIIPQEPVLFSGTLRKNLDPFEEYSDESLWQALGEVELKDIAGAQGLQTLVAAGGSNFSVGQRQLICLARAVLRNNKVLVLDEATANVDPQTDALIQETIRKRFADCTVLTVAHRLHTIMDSDKVLVMNAGRLEEYGTPYDLLQLPLGLFVDMVRATGPQESEQLKKIATEARKSIKKAE